MWKSIYLLLVLSFVIYCQSQTVSPQNTKVTFQFSQFGTFAGNPIIAQIQPYDTNNNPITGCVLGLNPFVASSPTPSLQIVYPTICQGPPVQFPYVITLVSNIAKNYSVSFTYQGQAIGDSPYTIGFTFGPISANNSLASGAGLTTATVGTTTTFTFATYDQHNNFISSCLNESDWGDFTIILTQPNNIFGQVVSCNSSYIYTATYQTNSTDAGFLYVQYLSNNFAQMPQIPNIISGPPYGPTCLIPISALNNETQAGVPETFVLECVDQYGNTMSNCSYFDMNYWVASFNSLSPQTNNSFNASMVTCSATQQGVYTFTYSNNVAALYNTNVYYRYSSNNAPNFQTLIKPGPPFDVFATGPGVTKNDPSNIAGVPSFFNINMADQYGNIISECLNSNDTDWDITATPPMLVPPQPPFCNNGTMTSNWTATDSSDKYSIAIAYNGTNARDSPYPTNVYSNILDPSQSSLKQLSSTSVKAGINLPFTVDGHDQYGNPIVNCSRVSNLFSVQAVNLGNTTIQITGSVTCDQHSGNAVLNGSIHGSLIGIYNLTVFYNNTQIKNSPQSFTVTPGPMDPALTYPTGAGFTNQTEVVAGSVNTFYLNQRDQYGNVISTCLGLEYEWNVVISDSNSVYLNESVVGTCSSSTGIYSIPFSITVTGSYQIYVYSIKSLDYANKKEIENSPGSVTITPGAFSANYSVTTVVPEAEVGDFVGVTVVPKDIYGNLIGACTTTIAIELEIFARYQTSNNLKIYSTGNMTCGNNIYSGNYYANTTGTYQVDVGYDIGGTYYPVGDTGITRIIYGAFSSSQSNATGPGVGTNDAQIVAGTPALINITTRNKNGYIIPANGSIDATLLRFFIIGINNTEYTITSATILGEIDNSIFATYNATNAQYYNVSISYNQTLIGNQTYESQVIAAEIDFNTILASNITSEDSGNGYFDLSATDAFRNPVVIPSTLDVTLSPDCSHPNVSCSPSGLLSFCSFTVQEAGVYCISIENLTSLVQYEIANSTILVSGGNGCADADNCNSNGVCYQDPNGSGFLCNCKNGYTGTTCNTKIKSHYMNLWLGVGLLIGLSILLLIIGVVLGCLLGRRNRGGKNLLN